jgi:hypothetical protein
MASRMARPEGFEPPTYGFEARRSIQLSYGRAMSEKVNDSRGTPAGLGPPPGEPRSRAVQSRHFGLQYDYNFL